MKRILALDMGNSGLKAALFKGGEIRERFRFKYGESFGAAEEMVNRFTPDGVAVCSVVPEWEDDLFRAGGGGRSCRILRVSSDAELPFRILVRSPAELGMDRICAAGGAKWHGAECAVIVDIGTAITIDTLTSEGFEGGAIFPGSDAVLKSLNESAAALPDIVAEGPITRNFSMPGRSTSQAMIAGMYWGLTGAVEKLVDRSVRFFDSSPHIYLTGGAAGVFRKSLDFPFNYDPDLVFRGLLHIFNYSMTE